MNLDQQTRRARMTLFFLSPAVAELITGSTPPLALIANPALLVINLVLYGCGILMIREIAVRWGKGWPSLFLLSCAFVIAEEGLMLSTLFDPAKNTGGRAFGVNWVWACGMFLVHFTVSVAIPLLFVSARFPSVSGAHWLGRRDWSVCAVLFVLDIVLMGATVYHPPLVFYLVELALIAALIAAAALAPQRLTARAFARPVPSPSGFGLFGFLAILIEAATVFNSQRVSPAFSIIVSPPAYAALVWLLLKLNHNGLWPRACQQAFATGAIAFIVLAVGTVAVFQRNIPVILVEMTMMLFLIKSYRQGLAENTEAV